MKAEFNDNEQLVLTSFGMPEKMALRWWYEQLLSPGADITTYIAITHKATDLSHGKILKSERSGLFCNFCGKANHEVKALIAGPAVYICDECVTLCNGIIAEKKNE